MTNHSDAVRLYLSLNGCGRSGKLVSLLPLGEFMRSIPIINYVNIAGRLTFLITFGNYTNPDSELLPANRETYTQYLNDIEENAKAVNLDVLMVLAQHERNQLQLSSLKAKEAARMFKSLDVCFRAELSKIFVGYIPANHARYWQQEKPFGELLYEAFPNVRTDLTSAGNCFAIEQYTACVFHLMRVVEKGLRALARERRIKAISKKPLEWNDWSRIISAIEAKAQEVSKWSAGPTRDKAQEFYRSAVGELYAFKDAYRNYVMHDRAEFDEHQAASVYHRVGEFMGRLAVHLSETNKGAIAWKKRK